MKHPAVDHRQPGRVLSLPGDRGGGLKRDCEHLSGCFGSFPSRATGGSGVVVSAGGPLRIVPSDLVTLFPNTGSPLRPGPGHRPDATGAGRSVGRRRYGHRPARPGPLLRLQHRRRNADSHQDSGAALPLPSPERSSGRRGDPSTRSRVPSPARTTIGMNDRQPSRPLPAAACPARGISDARVTTSSNLTDAAGITAVPSPRRSSSWSGAGWRSSR